MGEGRAGAGFPVAETLSVMIILSFGNIEIGASSGDHSLDLGFNVPTAVLQSGYTGRSMSGKIYELNTGHGKNPLPGLEIDKVPGLGIRSNIMH